MAKIYTCERCGAHLEFRTIYGDTILDADGTLKKAPAGSKGQGEPRGGRRVVPIHPDGPCKGRF